MVVEQSQELIEKFNKVFVEDYNKMISLSQGRFYPDLGYIYTRLYGHTPKMTFSALIGKSDGDGKFLFARGTNSDGKKEIFNSLGGEITYSFLDTCDNMGVNTFIDRIKGFYITEIGIIYLNTFGFAPKTSIYELSQVIIYSDDEESAKKLADTINEKLVLLEKNTDETESPKTKYLWVKSGAIGITTNELSFDRMNVELDKNYNDDLPYDRIKEILSSDKSELILFDGKPGTGKTTLIKKLMEDVDKKFLYVNTSYLLGTDPTKFVDFLLQRNENIVVLEDCEKLLLEREQGNVFMEVLLNLTDGILGDSVKPKFICSFNCSEKKLDKALLRRGRLSLKYTFNELSLEKTRKLIPEADKPLTLADIYNHEVENMVGAMAYSRVGF